LWSRVGQPQDFGDKSGFSKNLSQDAFFPLAGFEHATVTGTDGSASARNTPENLKTRRMGIARELARFVLFVGRSLFETVIDEGICGRFGRIGV
jgi:hypothetical protein